MTSLSPGKSSRPRTLSDESLLLASRVTHSVDGTSVRDNGDFVNLHTMPSSHSLTSLGSFQSLGSHSPRDTSHGTESNDGSAAKDSQQFEGAEQLSADSDTLDALHSLPSLFGHSRSFSADHPSNSSSLADFSNSHGNHRADTDSDRNFSDLRSKIQLHVDTGADGVRPDSPSHPLHKRVSRVKHSAQRSATHRRIRSGSSVPTTKRETDAHDAWKRLKDVQVSAMYLVIESIGA